MLELLDISDNLLSSPLDLRPLAQLRVISLGQRTVSRLTAQHFAQLPASLASLDISHCPLLVEIQAGSLERFSQLSQLSISHNPGLREVAGLVRSSQQALSVDLRSVWLTVGGTLYRDLRRAWLARQLSQGGCTRLSSMYRPLAVS